ncbi:MAG: N5-glutamine methyltransferase family protein [Bacteriovoracaceae bacterium]
MEAQSLENFFRDHQTTLQEKYPGINRNVFERWLNVYREKAELLSFYTDDSSNSFFITEVLKGTPFEYITKTSYFYDLELYVDSRVLIPRFETERLLERTLELFSKNTKPIRACDIGTGSGCLGLSLLRHLKCLEEIVLVDLEASALEVAKLNYSKLKFLFPQGPKVDFKEGDRLSQTKGLFDLIISNPPYIMENSDKEDVHRETYTHEPHKALFLKDNDYFEWFNEFFHSCFNQLTPEGVFAMEGSEKHLKELEKTIKNYSFSEVWLEKDYAKQDRFLFAKK